MDLDFGIDYSDNFCNHIEKISHFTWDFGEIKYVIWYGTTKGYLSMKTSDAQGNVSTKFSRMYGSIILIKRCAEVFPTGS